MLVLQNDEGSVEDANAYISAERANAWLSARALKAGLSEGLLVQACDFIDTNFAFPGTRKTGFRQPTQWPRVGVDPPWEGIPPVVKHASALTAVILERVNARQASQAQSNENLVNAPKVLESTSVTVGPLTKTEKYTVLTGAKAAAVVDNKEWDFEPVLKMLKAVFPGVKRVDTAQAKGSRWWNGEITRQ